MSDLATDMMNAEPRYYCIINGIGLPVKVDGKVFICKLPSQATAMIGKLGGSPYLKVREWRDYRENRGKIVASPRQKE